MPLHSGATALPHAGRVVVVVEGARQPLVQASQQLGQAPTVPPLAVQRAALRRVAQRGPVGVVRQQGTKPGLPQVERAAQRRT